MFAFFDGVSEGFKASREDIVDMLKEIRQEVQEIKAYEVSTGRNKTGLKVKMEALAIIDKHLQEVEE
jgi:hypothetical protein